MNLSTLPPQLTRNFWKKAVVFILAALLWFYVRGEQRVEKGVTIPLKFKVAEGMILVESSARSVQAILSGAQEEMERIEPDRISARFDLGSYLEPVSVSLPLYKSQLEIPGGLAAVRLYPSHVTVTLDQQIEKTLAVHPETIGKPAEGYRLSKITVNPTVISLKGPRSVLEKMQAVQTEPVDLTGKIRSFLEKVPLKLDPAWAGPELREKGVEVLVSIETHLDEKRLDGVELHAIKKMEDKRVVDCGTKKVSIWVQGTGEMLRLVRSDDVTAFVEVSRLNPGKFELPVQVNLPKGLNFVKVEPSQVELTVTENEP